MMGLQNTQINEAVFESKCLAITLDVKRQSSETEEMQSPDSQRERDFCNTLCLAIESEGCETVAWVPFDVLYSLETDTRRSFHIISYTETKPARLHTLRLNGN